MRREFTTYWVVYFLTEFYRFGSEKFHDEDEAEARFKQWKRDKTIRSCELYEFVKTTKKRHKKRMKP